MFRQRLGFVMPEIEFEGEKVAFAVANTKTAHDVAAALIGCTYYLDDPDVIWEISGVEWPGPVFATQGPVRQQPLTVPRFARGYIVEIRKESRLAPLIARATPPHIAAAEDARRLLAKAGIHHPTISNDDALQLADALASDDGQSTPAMKIRTLIATLLRRYELDRPYIGIAARWLEESRSRGEHPPIDVTIQLISAYRKLRDYAAALQCTDVVVAPDAADRISSTQRAILFTQRAAIHLDFYDYGRDEARLKSARKCASTAWAIEPSDQCSAVYGRLKLAEEGLQEERANAVRVAQRDRLDAMQRQAILGKSRPRG